MQVEHPYLWERHVTLRALWRLMVQDIRRARQIGLSWDRRLQAAAIMGVLLLRAAIRLQRIADEPWSGETAAGLSDRLIAATIVTMPLVMPFYFDYDLLLLAVPAVLIAGEVLHHDERKARLNNGSCKLRHPVFVDDVQSRDRKMTQVNGTVVLLTILAVQLIVRTSPADDRGRRTSALWTSKT